MHPFQGRFAVGRLELTMMNLSNKFEVSIFTRCEHINADEKCRKWGGLGWLGVTQGYKKMPPSDTAHTTSYTQL